MIVCCGYHVVHHYSYHCMPHDTPRLNILLWYNRADDVQVELVMLDPYVRQALTHNNKVINRGCVVGVIHYETTPMHYKTHTHYKAHTNTNTPRALFPP